MTIEGWPFFDSLYQVIITLSTVGFQEVNPLSEQGRAATMLLIVCGVGSFAYLVGSFTQLLIEGRLQHIFGRRRVQKAIDKLSGHIIICGCGRIGSTVTEKDLGRKAGRGGHRKDPEVVRELAEKGILHLAGDATDDEVFSRPDRTGQIPGGRPAPGGGQRLRDLDGQADQSGPAHRSQGGFAAAHPQAQAGGADRCSSPPCSAGCAWPSRCCDPR
jgi:hypothetical protein